MKKLLLLIIVLACMGCSKECEQTNVFGNTVYCNIPIDWVEEDACDWPMAWDDCTCQCEWDF